MVGVPEKEQFYLQTILALFRLIREFSHALLELNAETLKSLEKQFGTHKDVVLAYVDCEKPYFQDRDAEFENTIELLIAGMTDMNKEG